MRAHLTTAKMRPPRQAEAVTCYYSKYAMKSIARVVAAAELATRVVAALTWGTELEDVGGERRPGDALLLTIAGVAGRVVADAHLRVKRSTGHVHKVHVVVDHGTRAIVVAHTHRVGGAGGGAHGQHRRGGTGRPSIGERASGRGHAWHEHGAGGQL